jgi:putative ubiquitin-RnfH superfamily antitoxin RatB of RatAB toxin-antitoxin module
MLRITLMYSPGPRTVFEQVLVLDNDEATVETVIGRSELPRRFPDLDWRALSPGVWGKAAAWERQVADGDRIELCRALLVDPKVARRERFQRQGMRTTGLFARNRAGGKAGY